MNTNKHNKTIKNKEGKFAIELAETIEKPNLKKMVLKILGPPETWDFLMRESANRLLNRSNKLPIFAITYLLVCYGLQFIVIYPRLPWFIFLI